MTSRQKTTLASYASAFIVPMAIILVSFALLGMYPFGDPTISAWDLEITYTYFYEWFQNVLQGKAGLFYSFSKSLGGNMFAGYANLCASPLLLPLAFFPGDNVIPYVTFITVLRFGLAGVSCLFWLRNRFELDAPLAVALAVCYSQMLFMTSQAVNPLWIDSVIILPFILLGIYRIVSQGRSALFFVSLTATILIQWYNGYMACLFAVLFYLFESACYVPQARAEGTPVRLGVFVRAARFAVPYTLAVCASLIVLLPTALELLQGKGSVPGGLFDFKLWYSLPTFFCPFYPGVYVPEHFPQFYTGLLVLVSVVAFFFTSRIPVRTRVAAFALMGFMVVCTWYAPFDRIWCGFRDGNAFYCRFVYLISALLVFLAASFLEGIRKGPSIGALGAAWAVTFTGALCVLYIGYFSDNPLFLPLSLVAVSVYAALLAVYSKERFSRARALIGCALVALVAIEFLPTSCLMLEFRGVDNSDSANSRYEQYFSEGRLQYEELNAIDGDDQNAYRIGKTYIFLPKLAQASSSNEGFVYGYSQIAQYDSAYDDRVQNMMSALGYTGDWSCYTTYRAPIVTSDALLGLRFVADDGKPVLTRELGVSNTQDGNKFYENPYALPLGYGISESALDNEPSFTTDKGLYDDGHNPFVNQNKFIGWLAGDDVEYYYPVPSEKLAHDARHVEYLVEAPAGGPVYGFVHGSSWLMLNLAVDSRHENLYMHEWSHYTFEVSDASDVPSVHDIDLTMRTDIDESLLYAIEDQPFELFAYQLDVPAFDAAVAKLREHPFEIDKLEDGYVHGTYRSNGSDVLFTTIPYDAGWRVRVNGEEVEPRCVLDTFIAIPVEEGVNEVAMEYHAPGFALGAGISITAFILYLFANRLFARNDRMRRRPSDLA